MGWVDKVRIIIDGLKKAGKSKAEIADMVQQAADKATVAREIEKAMVTIAAGAKEMGKNIAKTSDAINVKKNGNNWRRMHGLPMRRKRNRRMRRERGKGTDNHSKNADVS